MLFIDADIDETGRYLFVSTNKGTSNKNELFVKDLGDPLAPKLDAPVRPLYPGPHRRLRSARRRRRHAVSADRSRRAEQEGRRGADRPARRRRTGRRSCPRARTPSIRRGSSPGKLAVNALVDVASDVRFYDLDGTPAGRSRTPGLGIDQRTGRPFRPARRSSTRSRRRSYPATVFRFDPATGNEHAVRAAEADVRSGTLRRPSGCSPRRRTARACRCSSRTGRA